jgi:hypothetical protein
LDDLKFEASLDYTVKPYLKNKTKKKKYWVLEFSSEENGFLTRLQCFTTVILAIQEAEVRRIAVRRQPRQIAHETLSQKPITEKG